MGTQLAITSGEKHHTQFRVKDRTDRKNMIDIEFDFPEHLCWAAFEILAMFSFRIVVSFGPGAWEYFIVTRLKNIFHPLLHFQKKIF